jgi:hypothetical protein
METEILHLINQPISMAIVLLIAVIILFVRIHMLDRKLSEVCKDLKRHILWHLKGGGEDI